MQTISLDDYNIYLGNIFPVLNEYLANRKDAALAVIVDANTAQFCLPIFKKNVERTDFLTIEVPAGEIHKNIRTSEQIWQMMLEYGLNRNAVCINLGGGVIGDMGGFCASTYKRGVDFIHLPTTLLSQVDSSIGGKLGIDFNQVKNSIGVFNNPQGVFIYPDFLKTLPLSEIRSGFGEMIKHSLIDSFEQWQKIKIIERLEEVNWLDYLVPSLLIKKRIVEIDPFEKGLRKALNFGHTIGHAMEGQYLATNTPLLHGEAVAAGMICESFISYHISGLPLSDLEEITDFLIRIYGIHPIQAVDYEPMLQLMRKDKKNIGNEINFTLLKSPGDCLINQTCPVNLIKESLDYYRSLGKISASN